MANQEQVEALTQGAAVWNAWRVEHFDVKPDLSDAILSGVDQSYAYLSDANLSGAYLNNANLSHAHLSHASLCSARLSRARLSRAGLGFADLGFADFSYADLSGANLSHANLSHANLSHVDLSHANLNETKLHATRISGTLFAWVDLCIVEGLGTVIHEGPSTVNINTVKLPQGDTLTYFLRGVGFSDSVIDYLPGLLIASLQTESWPDGYIKISKIKGYVAGLLPMICDQERCFTEGLRMLFISRRGYSYCFLSTRSRAIGWRMRWKRR